MTPKQAFLPPAIEALLRQRAEVSGPRIERVEMQGHTFWIKRPETLSLRMRLQKGDASEAFASEVEAHCAYVDKGLPVAPLVLSSRTFLVTRDCGPHLKRLIHTNGFDPSDGLAAAATALRRLHNAGVSHGRPSLKDICWHDGRVAFLDLERADRGSFAQDVQILIFSTAVETQGSESAMALMRDAYISAGGADVWKQACRKTRILAPVGYVLSPIIRLLPKNREFQAIRPYLRFMKDKG